MPSRRYSRNGQRRYSLRIASHNVRWLTKNGPKAARFWVSNNFDVVVLQEVHISASPWDIAAVHKAMSGVNAAAAHWARELKRPAHDGFEYRFCLSGDSREAGVMVLWRKSLISSGELEALPEQPGDRDNIGRLLMVRMKWGGHTLHLACVYGPNTSVGRQQLINQHLAPAWAAAPHRNIFIGDWNFVDKPSVDRKSRPGISTTSNDTPSSVAWQQAAPGALDAYRLKHPTTHGYTYFSDSNGHVARLDRAYISSELQQHVLACHSVPAAVSDHHPLLLELLPAVPPRPRGPGLRRANFDDLAAFSISSSLNIGYNNSCSKPLWMAGHCSNGGQGLRPVCSAQQVKSDSTGAAPVSQLLLPCYNSRSEQQGKRWGRQSTSSSLPLLWMISTLL